MKLKIGKLYIFIGNLYRPERMIFATRNGLIICGFHKQFAIHNFAFYDQMDKKFNGDY
jgi:hypothetical protein